MLIDIDRLPKEGLHVSRVFDFPSADLVEENTVFLEPAHAEVTVRKIGAEICVKGRITTRLSLVCSRCLMPFEFPVDSKFDLVFLPEELATVKDELDDEEINRMYCSSGRLDLRTIILEQLNLLFPRKPLCSDACEGICAVCGEIIRGGKCLCLVKGSGFQKPKILMRDKR